MAGRGMLSPWVQKVAIEHLGREISVKELRLMPYICTTMMDSQHLFANRINLEERDILQSWIEEGWITLPLHDSSYSLSHALNIPLHISKTFWDAITSILWAGYVAYNDPIYNQ